MNILLDLHTHSIASGHAYSTINEMVTTANAKNLKVLAITEHGPCMPGSSQKFYFQNLKVVPRKYGNLELLLGGEANIINYNGKLDFSESLLACLDIVIASLHTPCINPGTIKENTLAYIGAMKHPRTAIIGHPDDSRFPIDYEQLVLAAKENMVLLEINNSSLSPNSFRSNADENIRQLLTFCKKYKTPVILDSDAHIANDIGNFSYALPIIEELSFPSELIVNTSYSLYKEYIDRKGPTA